MEDIFKNQGARIHYIYENFHQSSNIFCRTEMAVGEVPYVSLCSSLIAAADVPVILTIALRPATPYTNHRLCHCSSQVLGLSPDSDSKAVTEDFDRAESNS
jgi:hypothetical protein